MIISEYVPSPLRSRLMLGRHSGIGNRIPRFPIFCRESGRESPIPDLAGKQGIPDSRFDREPGIGVPIRRAGDFVVCPGPVRTTHGPCGGLRAKAGLLLCGVGNEADFQKKSPDYSVLFLENLKQP